jgi:hypothetical protein
MFTNTLQHVVRCAETTTGGGGRGRQPPLAFENEESFGTPFFPFKYSYFLVMQIASFQIMGKEMISCVTTSWYASYRLKNAALNLT